MNRFTLHILRFIVCPIHGSLFYYRSLFVPYFKYLLDGCVQHLADSEDVKTGPTRKKKAKLSRDKKDVDCASYLLLWHLRALILSSLHKCFLYDTGNKKFLDSSNFQASKFPT